MTKQELLNEIECKQNDYNVYWKRYKSYRAISLKKACERISLQISKLKEQLNK